MMNSSYSFVTGSAKGHLDFYSPFEFEDKACAGPSRDSLLKSCYLMNRISHPDEGAIIDVRNSIYWHGN
jgi:hypothetical protein